jgi:hypothetical protein
VTAEQLVIGLIRIGGSVIVLRWAFVGAVIAILVDFSDLFLMNLLDLGGLGDYQSFDKALDLVYMVAFLVVALRWRPLERNIAVALFAYRMVGVAVFEATGSRATLIAFPNIFEFWFLAVAGRDLLWPDHDLDGRGAAVWLAVLTPLKLAHEFAVHGARWLDKYRATDVVADWWHALTPW